MTPNLHPALQQLRCRQDAVDVDEAVRASMRMGRVGKVADRAALAAEYGAIGAEGAGATGARVSPGIAMI